MRHLLVLIAATLWTGQQSLADNAAPYQRVLRSTGCVFNGGTHGTGWVVNKADRLLITNHHVCSTGQRVSVVFPAYRQGSVVTEKDFYAQHEQLRKRGLLVEGRCLYSDAARDLAVVQLDELPRGIVALALADQPARKGDRIHLVGNPGDAATMWVHKEGRVLRMVDTSQTSSPGLLFRWTWILESTVPATGGDSGGPLVNDAGQLVAVESGFRQDDVRVSLGIELSAVKEFMNVVPGLLRPRTAADFRRLGDGAVAARDWPAAEKAYRQALRLRPEQLSLSLDLAGVLFAQRKRTQGRKEVAKAVAQDDPMARALQRAAGLGLPTGGLERNLAGEFRPFDNGVIFLWTTGERTGQAFVVSGPIFKKYAFRADYSWREGLNPFGFPVADEQTRVTSRWSTAGREQAFERAILVHHASGDRRGEAYAVQGDIGARYQQLRGRSSDLGFPLSDEIPLEFGVRQLFEGGYMTWSADAGASEHLGRPRTNPDATKCSAFAAESVYLAGMGGLTDPGASSRRRADHLSWARDNKNDRVVDNLVEKFSLVFDHQAKRGKDSANRFYGEASARLAAYGIDLGDPGANLRDAAPHRDWAGRQTAEKLRRAIADKVRLLMAGLADGRE